MIMVEHPLTDFGERLRRTRESRGMSLRQVANVTRITVRALEAVERNDLSRLPGGIFTRSFVRAYAAEVGLDPEVTLREFLAQCPEEGAGIPTVALERMGGAAGSWPERVPFRLIRIGILLLALAGATAYAVVRWNATRQDLGAGPESANVSKGTAAAGVRVAPVVVPAVNSPAPPERAGGVVPLRIEAVALGQCWLSAQSDDGARLERLLASGERLVLTARQAIVLKTGDAGALTLTINGRPARPLGRAGEVVSVRIGTDNLERFLAP
jgi:transcriptional regulator with XRE-family HTH domain